MNSGRKIILNAGIYDLCHRGHIELLKKMRAAGDKVVVVIHDDQSAYDIKGKIPIQSIKQRCRNLFITKLVDEIYVTTKTDPGLIFEEVIHAYKDDTVVYMRGDDLLDFPGKWMLDRCGIKIDFVEYTKGVSSTAIKEELLKL